MSECESCGLEYDGGDWYEYLAEQDGRKGYICPDCYGMGPWLTVNVEHVIPLNDLYEHTWDISCQCSPEVDGFVVIHNAFDNREYIEELENGTA